MLKNFAQYKMCLCRIWNLFGILFCWHLIRRVVTAKSYIGTVIGQQRFQPTFGWITDNYEAQLHFLYFWLFDWLDDSTIGSLWIIWLGNLLQKWKQHKIVCFLVLNWSDPYDYMHLLNWELFQTIPASSVIFLFMTV